MQGGGEEPASFTRALKEEKEKRKKKSLEVSISKEYKFKIGKYEFLELKIYIHTPVRTTTRGFDNYR